MFQRMISDNVNGLEHWVLIESSFGLILVIFCRKVQICNLQYFWIIRGLKLIFGELGIHCNFWELDDKFGNFSYLEANKIFEVSGLDPRLKRIFVLDHSLHCITYHALAPPQYQHLSFWCLLRLCICFSSLSLSARSATFQRCLTGFHCFGFQVSEKAAWNIRAMPP